MELSNLHRQILHSIDSIGINKAESVKNSLKRLVPECNVVALPHRFTRDNAISLVDQFDIILDASDNSATRYLVNDACVFAGKVLVSASCLRWDGQLSVFNFPLSMADSNSEVSVGQEGEEVRRSGFSACYRCIFPQPPPSSMLSSCSSVGVMPPICGIMGTYQALECIKCLMKLAGGGLGAGLEVLCGFFGVLSLKSVWGLQGKCW